MPEGVPARAGNAARGKEVALHPQRPPTAARRSENVEGEPQEKVAGLTGRRERHKVEGDVRELDRLREEERGGAPPSVGIINL